LIVLACAVLLGIGTFHLARMIRGLEGSVVAARENEERFGPPASFTPQPDASIPADRMAAFLAVRDALAAPRAALVATFETMPVLRDEELDAMPLSGKLAALFRMGKSAAELGPRIGAFYRARDRAMLDAGIGMGEYAHIYTVAYHSWLGHDPTDGPRTDPRHASEGASDEFRVMAERTSSRIRIDLIQILRNQRAALPSDAPAAWRADLEAEIAAMQREEGRSPWRGDIPPAMAASLEPHRHRLEASYHPFTNPFELARTRKRGRFRYSSD
jgi:hypothetical protein